ncbi:MAG: hypothetical protein Tsb0020_27940 [Haliangiales bacterium]
MITVLTQLLSSTPRRHQRSKPKAQVSRERLIAASAIFIAGVLSTGCPKKVPVSTDDAIPPKVAVSVVSEGKAHSVETGEDPKVVNVRRGSEVILLASTSDPGGARDVAATVVAGGRIDAEGSLLTEISASRTVDEAGQTYDRVFAAGKLVFDSPSLDLVVRAAGSDFADNSATTATITLVQHEPPVARISVDRDRIDRGESVQVFYESENASEVYLNDELMGTLSGSRQFTPTQTTEYKLTAVGTIGRRSESVVVEVIQPPEAPIIDVFRASAADIDLGESISLRWETRNTTSIRISPGGPTSQSASGTTMVTPSTVGRKTFTLTAEGPGGTITATTTFDVNMPEQPEPDIECDVDVTLLGSTTDIIIGSKGSVWPADLRFDVSGREIVSIENESQVDYTLTVNSRAADIDVGETSTVHAGLPLAALYTFFVPGPVVPTFVKARICTIRP